MVADVPQRRVELGCQLVGERASPASASRILARSGCATAFAASLIGSVLTRATVPTASTANSCAVTWLPRLTRQDWGQGPGQRGQSAGLRSVPLHRRLLHAPGRIRTCDFCLRRAALYPLSYGRPWAILRPWPSRRATPVAVMLCRWHRRDLRHSPSAGVAAASGRLCGAHRGRGPPGPRRRHRRRSRRCASSRPSARPWPRYTATRTATTYATSSRSSASWRPRGRGSPWSTTPARAPDVSSACAALPRPRGCGGLRALPPAAPRGARGLSDPQPGQPHRPPAFAQPHDGGGHGG